MTYEGWRDATNAMQRSLSHCDEEQRMIGTSLGLEIPETMPRTVAVARLGSMLQSRFGFTPALASEGQLDLLEKLAALAARTVPTTTSEDECRSWIDYFSRLVRLQALNRLHVNKGDIVSMGGSAGQVDEVVSIGDDGRIYFTGGRAGAWPDQVKVVASKTDRSPIAEKARTAAANRASERAANREWSSVKEYSLQAYLCTERVRDEDIEDLRVVINEANDEKPIQTFLQVHPHLLTAIVGGWKRFCLPKVGFGGKYQADFLLAEVNSNGARCILVELETPNSSVTQATANDFDRYARKGISQVKDWRRWIQDNLAMARRPKGRNGLGLPDISPQSEGLVLVGRRDRLRPNAPGVRQRFTAQNNIWVHTYDRLLDQLEGANGRRGPGFEYSETR